MKYVLAEKKYEAFIYGKTSARSFISVVSLIIRLFEINIRGARDEAVLDLSEVQRFREKDYDLNFYDFRRNVYQARMRFLKKFLRNSTL